MKKIYFIVFVFLCLPLSAYAASVRLVPTPTQIGAGDTFTVSVMVDSATPVNTFSGELHYSDNVQLAGSERRQLYRELVGGSSLRSRGSRAICRPGARRLFRPGRASICCNFKAAAAGEATVSLQKTSFLRNDGSGNAEDVIASNCESR